MLTKPINLLVILCLSCYATVVSAATFNGTIIQEDGNLDGRIGISVDHYAFDVTAGTYLSFAIDSGIDPYIYLYDPSGTPTYLSSDDDGGPGFQSYLDYPFAEAGTYVLGVSTYRLTFAEVLDDESLWGGTGDYELTISVFDGSMTNARQIAGPIPEVPEPTSLLLLGCAAGGLWLKRRRNS